MPSCNIVVLMGNLTRDPELRYTPKGTAVAEFGLAINRHYTAENGDKREDTIFVDVTCWGRTAEIAQEFLKKGSPAHVEGRLDMDQWEDKETGKQRSKLKIVCESLQLLGTRDESKDRDREPRRDERREERSGYRRDPRG